MAPAKEDVQQYIKDIAANHAEWGIDNVRVEKVTEVEVGPEKRALIITLPFRHFNDQVKRIQERFTQELEKKSKRQVVLTGKRTIISKHYKRLGHQCRPRSRTLTAVHEAILEDIVGPTEIIGKRIRVRTDGSKLLKIHLDPKEKAKGSDVQEKLETFAVVYKKLTTKDAVFMFPENTA